VVAECDTSAVARKAAASKIVRAIGIESSTSRHTSHMTATLIQELSEEQFMAD
jgi:hypothetical protein